MNTTDNQDHHEPLSTILAENFGLGHEANIKRFTNGVLQTPFYINPNHKIKPNPHYEDPTPHDIALLKSKLSMSSGQLARWFVLDSRNLNAMVSMTGWEKGIRMSSALWSQWCESAGMTDRLIIRPIYADIREEVLRTTEAIPTKHELYLITSLAGLTVEELSDKTGLPFELLKANCFKGLTVLDDDFNYIKPESEHGELSKLHTTPCTFTRNEWKTIRQTLNIDGNFIKRLPALRASVFGNVQQGFNPYTDRRASIKNMANNGNSTLATVREYLPENAGLPFYEDVPFDTIYSPPTPLELRAVVTWTGFSIGELSMLLGMKPKELAFLQSVKAINHKQPGIDRKTGKEYEPRTFYISYIRWRRLCEVFNLCPPRKLIMPTEIE